MRVGDFVLQRQMNRPPLVYLAHDLKHHRDVAIRVRNLVCVNVTTAVSR